MLGKQVILRRYMKNPNACRRGYRLRNSIYTRARIQTPLQNTRFQYVDHSSKGAKLHHCCMHRDVRLRVGQSIDLDEVDCASLKSAPSAQSKGCCAVVAQGHKIWDNGCRANEWDSRKRAFAAFHL